MYNWRICPVAFCTSNLTGANTHSKNMTTKFKPYSLNGDLYRFMDYEADQRSQRMHPKTKSLSKSKKSASALKKSKSVPKRSTSSTHKAKATTKKSRAKSQSRSKSSSKKAVKKVVLKDQEQ